MAKKAKAKAKKVASRKARLPELINFVKAVRALEKQRQVPGYRPENFHGRPRP